jgi:SNF2 family DNA or RNA helicase
MGMGKTAATLTVVQKLMFNWLEVKAALVIAPKNVAKLTWHKEVETWDHLQGLRVSRIIGNAQQRLNALMRPADVYVISRDNLDWLTQILKGRLWFFDMVVVDELSSFKNHKSKRYKALRRIRPKVKRIFGLTGTPASNGYLDLWAPMRLLDMGQRLYPFIGQYREHYFTVDKVLGPHVKTYRLKQGAKEAIHAKISDICLSMRAEDYLELPKRTDHLYQVDVPDELMAKYYAFEKDLVLRLLQGDITVANAADLSMKLRQFTAGAIYDEAKTVHEIHAHKLDALEEIVEGLQGQPILVFYHFKHSLERIKQRLKPYGVRELKKEADLDAWNRGEVPVMVLHPASAGHGLNMQHGGHYMAYYDHDWSAELYQQSRARLDRQGQKYPVMNYRLVIPGTEDIEVIERLDGKITDERGLMAALRRKILKYTGNEVDV